MCERLQGATELFAAARALTLACMLRIGAPAHPLNQAYDHAACEPLPDDMLALLEQIGTDRGTA